MHENICVFSSWKNLPEFYFHGYCFVENDLIFGLDGANSFMSNGGELTTGEDGCNVIVRRVEGVTHIGSDFYGLDRLFYFSDGDEWAVSNSLLGLAQHLIDNGKLLQTNVNQLAAWFSNDNNFKQLLCEKTVFKEINLLPADQDIQIHQGRLRRVTRTFPLFNCYNEALSSYLHQWNNRIATILEANFQSIEVDVSGGLDTRTVVGFLTGANKENGGQEKSNLIFGTKTGKKFLKDAQVAREVAAALNAELGSNACEDTGFKYSAEQSIQRWRMLSLGQYSPLRFPREFLNPAKISVRGSGGEAMRGKYTQKSCQEYLDVELPFYGKHLCGNNKVWRSEIEETLKSLNTRSQAYQPVLLGYFRQYRSRIHAGTAARNKFSAFPLVGKSVFQCTAALGAKAVASRQLHFDVMHNLNPDLLHVPFDEAEKSPSADNLASLTSVDPFEAKSGVYYVGNPEMNVGAKNQLGQRNETSESELFSAFLGYLEERVKEVPKNFVKEKYLRSAIESVAIHASGEANVSAKDMKPGHNVALLAELAQITDLNEYQRPRFGFGRKNLRKRGRLRSIP